MGQRNPKRQVSNNVDSLELAFSGDGAPVLVSEYMRKKIPSTEAQEMFVETSLKPSTENDKGPQKMKDVSNPHENDVLMGRGGKNNQHSGNGKLRDIARERCEDYQNATKKGKSNLSKEIVKLVRNMTPPGRFLRKDPKTCRWEDVGDDIAREKTSQVLRDAVSLQSGLVSKVIKKSSTSTSSKTFRRRANEGDTADDQRDYPVSATRPQQRDLRTDQPYIHPYMAYHSTSATNEAAPPPILNTPPHYYHLPVTPASASLVARKRPRYYESPMPAVYEYGRVSHPSNMATNSPAGMILSSPLGRPQLRMPRHAGYFSASSHISTVSSPGILSQRHYVPPSGQSSSYNEPWVADVAPFFSVPAPAPASEFELLNDELFSDHSDREGAISPAPLTVFQQQLPKRDSMC